MSTLRQTAAMFALCGTTLIANAQKQPQVQESSVPAPAVVKIDGKLDEWANPFVNTEKGSGYLSAFNPGNRIYYTIANDDKNLYLVVRGLGNGVSKKVLSGGLIFTVSHAAEKKNRAKDPGNVAISFPVPVDAKTTSVIMSTINQVLDLDNNNAADHKSIDSLDVIADKIAADATKEIGISGIKEIPDALISIYNPQGIKAAIRFMKVQPAIEIAIPLKYLGLSADNPVAFSYNIRINAVPEASRVMPDPNAPSQTAGGEQPPAPAMATNPNLGYAWNPTDFWGEYTLVKK